MKKKEHIVPGYNMLQRYVYGGNFIFRKSHGLCTAGLQTLSNYPLSGEHLGWLMLKVQPFQDIRKTVDWIIGPGGHLLTWAGIHRFGSKNLATNWPKIRYQVSLEGLFMSSSKDLWSLDMFEWQEVEFSTSWATKWALNWHWLYLSPPQFGFFCPSVIVGSCTLAQI